MQSYHGYKTYRTASFTIRVPKDRFDSVTGNLEALGNVTTLRTDAQNITAQFYDTDSRLTSYRIQEERLLAMLESADNVTDMISLESRLSDIRYNIETLTSTLRNWQSQVDYSSVSLYIYEVERYTEIVPVQQRTYWQQIGDGLTATTKNVGEFFMNLFKWLVINLPVLGILAIIAVVIIIIVRRRVKKDKLRYETAQRSLVANPNMHYPPPSNQPPQGYQPPLSNTPPPSNQPPLNTPTPNTPASNTPPPDSPPPSN